MTALNFGVTSDDLVWTNQTLTISATRIPPTETREGRFMLMVSSPSIYWGRPESDDSHFSIVANADDRHTVVQLDEFCVRVGPVGLYHDGLYLNRKPTMTGADLPKNWFDCLEKLAAWMLALAPEVENKYYNDDVEEEEATA